jgi:hypothetical protein
MTENRSDAKAARSDEIGVSAWLCPLGAQR